MTLSPVGLSIKVKFMQFILVHKVCVDRHDIAVPFSKSEKAIWYLIFYSCYGLKKKAANFTTGM
jgi:hypothetical protein